MQQTHTPLAAVLSLGPPNNLINLFNLYLWEAIIWSTGLALLWTHHASYQAKSDLWAMVIYWLTSGPRMFSHNVAIIHLMHIRVYICYVVHAIFLIFWLYILWPNVKSYWFLNIMRRYLFSYLKKNLIFRVIYISFHVCRGRPKSVSTSTPRR